MDFWDINDIRPEPQKPQVLRSDDGAGRMIALSLKEGEALSEHQVHEHAWMLVLDGTLEVESGASSHQLSRESMVHFDPGERRTVRAKTEATILYMLVPWPGVGHPRREAATAV